MRISRDHTVHVEWKIPNFLNLPSSSKYYLDSAKFFLSDAQWFIRIYPNYNGYVSLEFRKTASAQNLSVWFAMGIKDKHDSLRETFCKNKEFGKEKCGCEAPNMSRDYVANYCHYNVLTIFLVACILDKTAETKSVQPNPLTDGRFLSLSELRGYENRIKELEEKLSVLGKEKTVMEEKLSVLGKEKTAMEEKLSVLSKEKTAIEDSLRRIQDIENNEKTLSEQFQELFLNEYEADTTVNVKGKELKVHKSVLVARSLVFRAMFEADMKEKNSNHIDINDCEPDTFLAFIFFVYSNKFDVVTSSNAMGLYLLADKYNFEKLKVRCSECICQEITVDSVCDIVPFATLHNEQDLLDVATEFFLNNSDAIIPTDKWMSFLAENLTVANELLLKMAMKMRQLS